MAHATQAASAVDQFFNTMGRFDLLAKDEVIELSRKIQAWQQHPNGPEACPPITKRIGVAARNKLVRHNLRLVVKVWNGSYRTRMPARAAGLPDMLQMGAKDLVRAAEKFDATTGYTFSTYAVNWIHKGMKDYLGGEDRTIRMPTNTYFLVKAAMLIQVSRTGEGLAPFTMEELIEEMAKTRRRKNLPSPQQMGEWLDAYTQTNARSFSEMVGDDRELGDLIAVTTLNDESADPVLRETRKAMGYLTEFERTVIETKYFRKRGTTQKVGHTYVGRVLKASVEDVDNAEARAFKRIKLMVAG